MKKYLLSLLMIVSIAPINGAHAPSIEDHLLGVGFGYCMGAFPPLLVLGFNLLRHDLKDGLSNDTLKVYFSTSVGVAAGLTVFGFAVYGIKKFINRNKEKTTQKEEAQQGN
jgi:hypothetical protein